MGETEHHHHPPPPQAAAPPGEPPNLGLARGPTWTPAEQLHQLQYCINSNPSWPQALLLAFQHYIVNLGTAVLIASTIVHRLGGTHFNDILNTIFSSPPTVAMIVETVLDITLEANHVEDRRVPWWKPFQQSKGDVRTEEFYGYPLRLNEYMPTRFL